MTFTACDQPDPAPDAPPVAVTGDTFIAATAEIDDARLAALADAFDADPVGVVDRLERDAGGRSALRRYLAAMLDHDEAARLGRQSAMVLSDAQSLARPETQDGGVWYPHAEDAGFFTGAVAAALASKRATIGDFARGAGRPAPSVEDLETWLSAPASDLPRPARAAFDDAFRAAAYHAR
jgi:hypothetical protein